MKKMRTDFYLLLPVMAALMLVTSCKKDHINPDQPSVSITSPVPPAQGGTLLRHILIQVRADAASGKSIERVEFYVDGSMIPGGTDTDAPYECAYEETSQFSAARTITAVAYDNEGVSDSAAIAVRFFNAVEKTPMPTSRYSFTADVVNGKIYVVGGNDSVWHTVEEYDPATDTWTTKTPSTFGHAGAASCVVNNLIYVFGGGDETSWTSNVEAYDPAANTWITKASIPIDSGGPVGLSTASLCNGKVYLMGGEATTDPARIVEYDPATDTWALRNEYKAPYNARAISMNNTIYFFGGCPYHTLGFCFTGSDSTQMYDPAVSVWSNLAPMTCVHTGHAAAPMYPYIYVFGGTPNNAVLANCDVDRYDAATNTWTALAPMPNGFMNFGCCTVGTKIYIIGQDHLYEYTPD